MKRAAQPSANAPGKTARYDFSASLAPKKLVTLLQDLTIEADATGASPDMYGVGALVQQFESEIAAHLRKDACVFCTSGTGAQQALLRSRVTDGGWVAVHPTSHIVWLDCLTDGEEMARGFRAACSSNAWGLRVEACGEAHRVLSLADVEACVAQDPPAVLCVELGQRMNGGACVPWKELLELRALCTQRGVWLHMDGARLWEAAPFYGRPVSEIAAQFDSVYVSFYKGLGALSGAALLGPSEAISDARRWLKRLGTVPFTQAPLVLSARKAFKEQQSKFPERLAQLKLCVEALSREPSLRSVVRFDPQCPQSSLVHVYIRGDAAALEAAHLRVQESTSVKLWNRLRGSGHSVKHGVGGEQYFEWNMGPHNAAMPLEEWLAAWRLLAAELSPS